MRSRRFSAGAFFIADLIVKTGFFVGGWEGRAFPGENSGSLRRNNIPKPHADESSP